MVQAGTVFLSASQTSAVPDWDFSLDVPIGDHDLLARSSATGSVDKLVVRRNQLITAAVTEPTIDVAADGIALDLVEVDVSNAISGTTDVSTWFDGAFIFEQQQANNASALPVKTEVVPASVLLPMEQQSVSFSTTDDSRANDLASQWCTESFTDTPAHIDLIPVPSVSFRDVSGAVTASWPNALQDDAEAVLSLSTSCTSLPCANQSSETAVVTSRWLARHGQTTLALGSYPDQLDPSQRVDLGAAHDEMFAIDEFGATATYETTVIHLDHSGAP